MRTFPIQVIRGGKPLAQSTAWFVRRNIVVTAFHTVANDNREWWPEAEFRLLLDDVTHVRLRPHDYDEKADVALLQTIGDVDTSIVADAVIDIGSSQRAALDDGGGKATSWSTIGYPTFAFHNGNPKPYSIRGTIDYIHHDRPRRQTLQLTIQSGGGAESWKGISGSPIMAGECADGIITEEVGGSALFGAPISVVHELLDKPERHTRATAQRIGGDPLEQALGYATHAFRDYLEQSVVRNVELMYFLGYDPWDGCLLYDGLVEDSIEETILRYARNCLLGRDRLRSRYRQLDKQPEGLGVAGQCYRNAVASVKNGSDPLDVERIKYVGDLRRYHSEYDPFDRLLGLGCCLYLPVVCGAQLGGEDVWVGGVLMAAAREPYDLKPIDSSASREWEEAKRVHMGSKPDEDILRDLDDRISAAISRPLRPSISSSLRDGRDVQSYLNCILKVAQARALNRYELKRVVHPIFMKAAAKTLKGERASPPAEGRDQLLKKVEAGLMDLRESSGDVVRTVDTWLAQVIEGQRPNEPRDTREYGWVRDYVALFAWRDLALELRKHERSAIAGDQEPTKSTDIQRALSQRLKWGIGRPLDEYVKEQAQEQARTHRSMRQYHRPERLAKFPSDLIDDVLDELRDSNNLWDVLRRPLDLLGPVSVYLGHIRENSPRLGVEDRVYVNDLSHCFQTYLLGLWLLLTVSSDGSTLKQSLTANILRYFDGEGRLPRDEREHLRELSRAMGFEDAVVIYWGLVVALHDVAIPMQRFSTWCREFITRYYGESVVKFDRFDPAAIVDIFNHPRFPVYKNAIIGLYSGRQRDWLDTIFCQELSRRMDHGIVGSLILMKEIEPDDDYSADSERALWVTIPKTITRLVGGKLHEPRLVFPAYLAHAIALSNLPEIRRRWIDEEDARSKLSKPTYFRDVADEFRVAFEEYPLTFLLTLCDILLEPTATRSDPLPVEYGDDPRGVGTSPFFVRRVQVADDAPRTISITLHLWDEDFDNEGPGFICSEYDLTRLIDQWNPKRKGEPIERWIACARPNVQLNLIGAQDTGVGCESWHIADLHGSRVMIVDRRVFEVARIVARLNEFDECYASSEWTFKVEFPYVRTAANQPFHVVMCQTD